MRSTSESAGRETGRTSPSIRPTVTRDLLGHGPQPRNVAADLQRGSFGRITSWSTIGNLGTAGGTLALAISTFASVRSTRRSAQVTERALLASIRPVLTTTRFGDPPEKIGFQDDHRLKVEGGTGVVDVTPTAIYMGIALRNVGNGLAVLDRWDVRPGRSRGAPTVHVDHAHRLTRDLYIAARDQGFWQGALRDPAEPDFVAVRDAMAGGDALTVDLLYGDHEGGQRTITRIGLLPAADGRMFASVSRHWNLDRADPRHEGEIEST